MMKSRVSAGLRSFTAAALLALGLVTIGQGPASAEVVAVSGNAVGYQTEVSLFGGPEGYRGAAVIPSPVVLGKSGPHDGLGQFPCNAGSTTEPAGCAPDPEASASPRVVLPSTGSETPIIQTDVDGAMGAYGPGAIFGGRDGGPSGPITVSTQGTTGPTGSATSSVDIVLDNELLFPGSETSNDGPGGVGPTVNADEVHSTCTARESRGSGLSGSASFLNGVVTDGMGGVLASVPNNPAPNTEVRGQIPVIDDFFTVIFNEQLFNTDGDPATDDITVNAMHMILEGPTGAGHMIVGQVHCGKNDGTTSVTTTTQPAGGGATTTTTAGGAATTSTTTPGGGATTTTTTAAVTTTTTTPAGGATTTTTAAGATTTTTPAGATTTTTTTPRTQSGARVSDDTVTPGQDITVSGGGFAANAELTITFFSNPVVLGTVRSDVAGQFSKSVRIPPDATAGPHRIVVSGLGPSGDTRQAVAPVTVAGATAPESAAPAAAAGTRTPPASTTRATGTLPRTGAAIEPLIVMSLVTVVVGTVLVLWGAPLPAPAAPRSRTRRLRGTGRQSCVR